MSACLTLLATMVKWRDLCMNICHRLDQSLVAGESFSELHLTLTDLQIALLCHPRSLRLWRWIAVFLDPFS